MACKGIGWAVMDCRPGRQAKWPYIYRTRRAARRRAEQLGPGWVEIRVCNCPAPTADDARGWDDYRLRHGIASR